MRRKRVTQRDINVIASLIVLIIGLISVIVLGILKIFKSSSSKKDRPIIPSNNSGTYGNTLFCKSCGAAIKPNSAYCPECKTIYPITDEEKKQREEQRRIEEEKKRSQEVMKIYEAAKKRKEEELRINEIMRKNTDAEKASKLLSGEDQSLSPKDHPQPVLVTRSSPTYGESLGNVLKKSQDGINQFELSKTSDSKDLHDGGNKARKNNQGTTIESNRLFNEIGMRLQDKYGAPAQNHNALDAFGEINHQIQYNKSIPSQNKKLRKTLNKTKTQESHKIIEEKTEGIVESPGFNVNEEKLKQRKIETQEVQEILGKVLDQDFDNEIKKETRDEIAVTNSVHNENESLKTPAIPFPSDTLKSLNVKYFAILDDLLKSKELRRDEFNSLVRRHNLMPQAVIDDINTWADDELGDNLLEESEDRIIINFRK